MCTAFLPTVSHCTSEPMSGVGGTGGYPLEIPCLGGEYSTHGPTQPLGITTPTHTHPVHIPNLDILSPCTYLHHKLITQTYPTQDNTHIPWTYPPVRRDRTPKGPGTRDRHLWKHYLPQNFVDWCRVPEWPAVKSWHFPWYKGQRTAYLQSFPPFLLRSISPP